MDPSSLHKLEHALQCTEQLSSFGGERSSVPSAVRQALEWMSHRSPQQIVAEREETISRIEQRAAQLRASGQHSAWLQNADVHVRHISRNVSGVLA